MQKHVALLLAPGRLVTTGLFRRTRNPNYLGELLIYASFTALALHWVPLSILGAIVLGLWVPNMSRKDLSLSRYPEFSAYCARSGLLFPRLW
jgi:steroid 5-alpha reductase family enzyme